MLLYCSVGQVINTFLRTCLCACLYVFMYVHMWRPEDDPGGDPQEHCPSPLRQGLSLIWNSPTRLDWLAVNPQGSPISSPQTPGLQMDSPTPRFSSGSWVVNRSPRASASSMLPTTNPAITPGARTFYSWIFPLNASRPQLPTDDGNLR